MVNCVNWRMDNIIIRYELPFTVKGEYYKSNYLFVANPSRIAVLALNLTVDSTLENNDNTFFIPLSV